MERQDRLQLELKAPEDHQDKHAARRWRGISVQFAKFSETAEYAFSWDGHVHYLAYHDLVLEDGEMQVRGGTPIPGRDLRNTLTYVPVGHAIEGWAKPASRMNSFTVVYFDPAVMEEELQAEFHGSEPRAHIYFQDNTLGMTMRKLAKLMADPDRPASGIYMETVGLTAALEAYGFSRESAIRTGRSGQLTKAQRTLIGDYIEAHLHHDIGLDDLASVCRLSRFHFSRAFKATFGDTPSQYLSQQRIEKAKQMLATTGLSVSDIALCCGFNGVSQFGRSFRAFVGTSPLDFRRCL